MGGDNAKEQPKTTSITPSIATETSSSRPTDNTTVDVVSSRAETFPTDSTTDYEGMTSVTDDVTSPATTRGSTVHFNGK